MSLREAIERRYTRYNETENNGDKKMMDEQADKFVTQQNSLIPLDKIQDNSWNFNKLSEEEYAELKKDIDVNGIKEKIILRPYEDGYQIVDGSWRISALKKKGATAISKDDVEIKELNDSEVRVFIRSTKIRGSHINCIKEAEHYKVEVEEGKIKDETLSLTANRLNMDAGNLSRILRRNNMPIYVKDYVSKNCNLSSSIIDEIFTVRESLIISMLELAEREHWSYEETRMKLRKAVLPSGENVKEHKKKEPLSLGELTMEERGAISSFLQRSSNSLAKLKQYLEGKQVKGLDGKFRNILGFLENMKDSVEGEKLVYSQSNMKMVKVGNRYRTWLLEGEREEQEKKYKAVQDKIKELYSLL